MREFLKVYLPCILLTVVGLIVAWQFVGPKPPSRIVMATGAEGGAYAMYGRDYARLLSQNGIELELRETSGSVENVKLLQAGEVDVAFVQSGADAELRADKFVSLGSAFVEPVWVFKAPGSQAARISDLCGSRVGVGPAGSGTEMMARALLREAGCDGVTEVNLKTTEIAAALAAKSIDAAFVVSSPTSESIQELLKSGGTELVPMTDASAYEARLRYLKAITLYKGLIDLRGNVPPEDVPMLSVTATLVAPRDIHPALVPLLCRAMTETHQDGGLLEKPGEFPTAKYTVLRVNDDARRYFKNGPPFLQKFLPFWAAVMVDRLIVMLIPLLTLMIPLFKIVPPTYRWRIRSSIYKWYKNLDQIEEDREKGKPAAELHERLDRIEHEVREMNIPLSYMDSVYDLRLHIDLIRRKIE